MDIELITQLSAVSLDVQFIMFAIYLKTNKFAKTFEWLNWLSLMAMWLYYIKMLIEDTDSTLSVPFFLIVITILLLNIVFKIINGNLEKPK